MPPPRLPRQRARQESRDGDAREVVVAQRRVADVRRNEDFVVRRPGEDDLAVGQRPWAERALDADVVLAVLQGVEAPLRHAEAPRPLVVRRPIRHDVGSIAERVQVRTQLGERHPRADWHAVADDVQVRRAEVHDAPPGRVGDPGVADVPLVGHRPVEHLGARRHLVHRQRDVAREDRERAPDAVARDAPADGEELLDEGVHRRAVGAAGRVGRHGLAVHVRGEVGEGGVAGSDDHGPDGPLDGEARVVPPEASSRARADGSRSCDRRRRCRPPA